MLTFQLPFPSASQSADPFDLSSVQVSFGIVFVALAHPSSRKLLTRSVYAAPPEGDKGGQKALTKPDILNLISSDVIHLEQMTWTVAQVVELILSLAIGCVFLWSLLGQYC